MLRRSAGSTAGTGSLMENHGNGLSAVPSIVRGSHTVVVRALIIHNPIATAARNTAKRTGMCNGPNHIRKCHIQKYDCEPPAVPPLHRYNAMPMRIPTYEIRPLMKSTIQISKPLQIQK